ncbi:MAG: hypothetical protein E7233_03730 [Lachnospiraceae bacterium]|nr:hypothetical protein [Lachnospiraceae bacterium]
MAKKKTFENIISNLLGEPVSNLCHAFYDQYVEANVKFRSRAGMKEVIIRRQLGKCCEWCADLAGIYTPENAPDDIYRRHDNCKCMVTYRDEDGYQDVWSKKEFESQKEARWSREQWMNVNRINNVGMRKYKGTSLDNKYVSFSSNNLFSRLDPEGLHDRANHVPKKEKCDDVFIHGDKYGFSYVDADGKESDISAYELGRILLEHGRIENDTIRLFACEAGKDEAYAAQGLANATGKTVLAPTEKIWLSPLNKDGVSDIIIAEEIEIEGIAIPDKTKLGDWRKFEPKKRND